MATAKGSNNSGWFVGAVVCVALAAALVVLPFVGVFWGLRELVRWRRSSSLPVRAGRPMAGAAALLAGVLVLTAGAVSLATDNPADASGATASAAVAIPPPVPSTVSATSPTSLASPPATSASPTRTGPPPNAMPSLAGDQLDLAMSVLNARNIGYEHEDLSPRDRSVWQEENWTVVATWPEAGEPLPAGVDVTLYLLKNGEAAWFAKHQTMPKLTVGQSADKAVDRFLAPVAELLEYRYPKGAEPKYASPAWERAATSGRGLADEPESERNARAGLAGASQFGLVAKSRSIPRPGKHLRPGQLLVVLVRDVPSPPSSGGDVPYVPVPDHDDDDVNVPGWLCPTRFC
ncbi:hypothetical protein GCM10009867_17120 [Pedococcus aerophilus]|uniref:PASTA domain-containing protein n=1 Tax=Pedococcus aerophilus TaxID=436356 RepID=A0ABP6H1E6_9MICO